MSQHLPVRIARPAFRQWPLPRCTVRSFSATNAAFSKKKATRQRVDAGTARLLAQRDETRKAPATVRAEEMQKETEMREDLGLLPGTFVRDWGVAPPMLPQPMFPLNMQSIKKSLGVRWSYEFKYVKRKVADLAAMLYYKWWIKKGKFWHKPKEIFDHRHVRRIAQENYVALYEALASKNEKNLESFCLSGLQGHLRNRFAMRPEHVGMTWKLVKKDSRPKVLSNRMSVYPFPGSSDRNAPCCFRQVVVRLKTRQSLTIGRNDQAQASRSGRSQRRTKQLSWTPDAVVPETNVNVQNPSAMEEVVTRDVVEYVVLQKRMWKGEEQPWKLWGFTDATTMQRLLEDEEHMDAMNKYEAAHPELASN